MQWTAEKRVVSPWNSALSEKKGEEKKRESPFYLIFLLFQLATVKFKWKTL